VDKEPLNVVVIGAYCVWCWQVFDISEFKRRLAVVVKSQPSWINPHQFNRHATFSFSLGRHCAVDVETPLWFVFVHLEALDNLGRMDGQFLSSSSSLIVFASESETRDEFMHIYDYEYTPSAVHTSSLFTIFTENVLSHGMCSL